MNIKMNSLGLEFKERNKQILMQRTNAVQILNYNYQLPHICIFYTAELCDLTNYAQETCSDIHSIYEQVCKLLITHHLVFCKSNQSLCKQLTQFLQTHYSQHLILYDSNKSDRVCPLNIQICAPADYQPQIYSTINQILSSCISKSPKDRTKIQVTCHLITQPKGQNDQLEMDTYLQIKGIHQRCIRKQKKNIVFQKLIKDKQFILWQQITESYQLRTCVSFVSYFEPCSRYKTQQYRTKVKEIVISRINKNIQQKGHRQFKYLQALVNCSQDTTNIFENTDTIDRGSMSMLIKWCQMTNDTHIKIQDHRKLFLAFAHLLALIQKKNIKSAQEGAKEMQNINQYIIGSILNKKNIQILKLLRNRQVGNLIKMIMGRTSRLSLLNYITPIYICVNKLFQQDGKGQQDQQEEDINKWLNNLQEHQKIIRINVKKSQIRAILSRYQVEFCSSNHNEDNNDNDDDDDDDDLSVQNDDQINRGSIFINKIFLIGQLVYPQYNYNLQSQQQNQTQMQQQFRVNGDGKQPLLDGNQYDSAQQQKQSIVEITINIQNYIDTKACIKLSETSTQQGKQIIALIKPFQVFELSMRRNQMILKYKGSMLNKQTRQKFDLSCVSNQQQYESPTQHLQNLQQTLWNEYGIPKMQDIRKSVNKDTQYRDILYINSIGEQASPKSMSSTYIQHQLTLQLSRLTTRQRRKKAPCIINQQLINSTLIQKNSNLKSMRVWQANQYQEYMFKIALLYMKFKSYHKALGYLKALRATILTGGYQQELELMSQIAIEISLEQSDQQWFTHYSSREVQHISRFITNKFMRYVQICQNISECYSQLKDYNNSFAYIEQVIHKLPNIIYRQSRFTDLLHNQINSTQIYGHQYHKQEKQESNQSNMWDKQQQILNPYIKLCLQLVLQYLGAISKLGEYQVAEEYLDKLILIFDRGVLTENHLKYRNREINLIHAQVVASRAFVTSQKRLGLASQGKLSESTLAKYLKQQIKYYQQIIALGNSIIREQNEKSHIRIRKQSENILKAVSNKASCLYLLQQWEKCKESLKLAEKYKNVAELPDYFVIRCKLKQAQCLKKLKRDNECKQLFNQLIQLSQSCVEKCISNVDHECTTDASLSYSNQYHQQSVLTGSGQIIMATNKQIYEKYCLFLHEIGDYEQQQQIQSQFQSIYGSSHKFSLKLEQGHVMEIA